MATGGGPTMYKYHTPSGDKTMDGLSMALRRGLGLRDMEMVQFHPTGLLAGTGTKMTGTVLEEGLRGAGGHLINGDQKRFMFDYDDAGERATRDIVSRAIYEEMRQGRTSPYGGVYISMAHLGPDNVAEKFAGMVKRCADSGFDLAGASSKWCQPRIISWAVWWLILTPAPVCLAFMWRARMQAGRMARTVLVEMA